MKNQNFKKKEKKGRKTTTLNEFEYVKYCNNNEKYKIGDQIKMACLYLIFSFLLGDT